MKLQGTHENTKTMVNGGIETKQRNCKKGIDYIGIWETDIGKDK